MPRFEDILRLYDYRIPRERIAAAPVNPRDSARLLVYRRAAGEVTHAVFRDIGQFLPPRSLLVLNETKVIPARLTVTKPTGGLVSLLLLGREGDGLRALADRKLKVGDTLTHARGATFLVEESRGHEWILIPSFPADLWMDACEEIGEMPLPPYIKETPLTPAEQRREYQTVFARERGSIAAPTASLHFTERLLHKLQKAGHDIAYITLHVHLGTFAPLTEEQWKKGALHREEYRIHPGTVQMIERAKREKRPIIAVGTTVVRTLESASDASGHIVRPSGTTTLFIKDTQKFKLVDAMITNFHVPKSSLMMLVSSFVGRSKLLELYKEAVEKEYRFFSFGDGMLIL